MTDRFAFFSGGVESPASDGFAITLSDVTDFAFDSRAIYVGVTGNIAAVMQSGAVVNFVSVPAGTILPIRATRINATGTTATSLVGLL